MKIPFPFRFIHAADLHLDSPFRIRQGKVKDFRSDLLNASLEAFRELCNVAISSKVDFIILAGDIYDGFDHGVRAQLSLRREIQRLGDNGIGVYAAYGNHDPIIGGREAAISWPNNLIRFGTTPETFPLEREGIKFGEITGISYQTREERRNLAEMFPQSNPDCFSIAVLHANVGSSSEHGNYAPAALFDLIGKGYDYWALGHIHRRTVLFEDPLIIYPGNIQGLHMKPSERGLKGAELVEVTPGGIRHSFVPLSQVIFDLISVDVGTCGTLDAIVDTCVESIRTKQQEVEGRPLVVRISLVGVLNSDLGNLDESIDAIYEDLSLEIAGIHPPVFLDQLEADLVKRRSLDDLKALSDVVGELIREIVEWRNDPARLTDFSIDSDLRNNLSARLKKVGLSDSLVFTLGDLSAAEKLLADLLGGRKLQ